MLAAWTDSVQQELQRHGLQLRSDQSMDEPVVPLAASVASFLAASCAAVAAVAALASAALASAALASAALAAAALAAVAPAAATAARHRRHRL